jgi:hypothetical protein
VDALVHAIVTVCPDLGMAVSAAAVSSVAGRNLP